MNLIYGSDGLLTWDKDGDRMSRMGEERRRDVNAAFDVVES